MTHLALAASVVSALFCVTVAGCKGRDLGVWVLLGLALPIVAMIAVLALPPAEATARERGR